MADTKKNPVANKFALIYQFNNASPLFARVAAAEIENENLNKAIEILESGISLNPEYPSAYFIYAKAMAITGNLDKANEMVKKGTQFLNSPETEEYYLALTEKLFEKSTPIKESRRVSFVDENILSDEEGSAPNEDSIETTDDQTPAAPKFEDRLDDIANQLSSAKMKPDFSEPEDDGSFQMYPPPEKEEDDIAPNMVSETLAGIFLAQQNYKQAKKIYRKLVEKHPAKMNLYAQKIAELDRLIEEQG